MPKLILPTFYYHDHFLEMLQAAVEAAYESILEEKHRAFLRKFRSLTKDEQCLYVRLVNRKGYIFHRSTLRYPEIEENACDSLLAHGLIREPLTADFGDVLMHMTKEQLAEIVRESRLSNVSSSWPKVKLVAHIAEHFLTSSLPRLNARPDTWFNGMPKSWSSSFICISVRRMTI